MFQREWRGVQDGRLFLSPPNQDTSRLSEVVVWELDLALVTSEKPASVRGWVFIGCAIADVEDLRGVLNHLSSHGSIKYQCLDRITWDWGSDYQEESDNMNWH